MRARPQVEHLSLGDAFLARSVAAGHRHTVVCTVTGEVLTWGGEWCGEVTATPQPAASRRSREGSASLAHEEDQVVLQVEPLSGHEGHRTSALDGHEGRRRSSGLDSMHPWQQSGQEQRLDGEESPIQRRSSGLEGGNPRPETLVML